MSGYASKIRRSPDTLTLAEQRALLKASGKYRDTFRDHVLFSIALGTALREHEIAALNVGDVAERADGKTWRIKRRVTLRVFKRSNGTPGRKRKIPQEIFLPNGTAEKIRKFLAWKKAHGEALQGDAPLLATERPRGRRLATRTIRHIFREWQRLAAFDRFYSFHELRHTAATNMYAQTKDIRAVQRLARHARIETTELYTHLSDEKLYQAVKDLPS